MGGPSGYRVAHSSTQTQGGRGGGGGEEEGDADDGGAAAQGAHGLSCSRAGGLAAAGGKEGGTREREREARRLRLVGEGGHGALPRSGEGQQEVATGGEPQAEAEENVDGGGGERTAEGGVEARRGQVEEDTVRAPRPTPHCPARASCRRRSQPAPPVHACCLCSQRRSGAAVRAEQPQLSRPEGQVARHGPVRWRLRAEQVCAHAAAISARSHSSLPSGFSGARAPRQQKDKGARGQRVAGHRSRVSDH